MRSLFKNKIFLVLIFVIFIVSVHFEYFSGVFYRTFYKKNELDIFLSQINMYARAFASEPSNKVYLKAEIKDSTGRPIPNMPIDFSVDNGVGLIQSPSLSTNRNGECIVAYTPPTYFSPEPNGLTADITATISGTNKKSVKKIDLVPVPIIFVHGYREGPNVFDNLGDFLIDKGYSCNAIAYDSTLGVDFASEELALFLQNQKREFLNNGIQVTKFDLITHSMGGLVARYYSSSRGYIENNDINKIIFLSVPHRGSILASIAENYYDDQSIKNLMPDNELFSETFGRMINKGLNSSIQVGNILSQYDEVVSEENASLDKWGIRTEIFGVGENSFTMDSLLSGNILDAPNHKGILNNNRVFGRILQMLSSDLPYPTASSK
ncbi:MAG: alpha/beta hydrolase [Clostridium sp.]|nr:alpha/beta hydrolase [Clostridium sp.]